MGYRKHDWRDDDTTPLDDDTLDEIEQGIADSYNVPLLAVSETAPSECSEGDKYYNTETGLIYTATATDTWGTVGEEPIEDILYVVFSEKNTYAWNGTDMLSVGGGSGSEIVVGDEEPTEDTKMIIDTDAFEPQYSDITDEYSEASNMAYSCNYINDCNTYSTSEVKTDKTWIDGKPIYRKIFTVGTSNTNEQVNHNISNIDTICNFVCYLKGSDGTTLPTPWFNNFQSQNYFKATMNRTVIDKSANNTWNFSVLCIAEYTKTTD